MGGKEGRDRRETGSRKKERDAGNNRESAGRGETEKWGQSVLL